MSMPCNSLCSLLVRCMRAQPVTERSSSIRGRNLCKPTVVGNSEL